MWSFCLSRYLSQFRILFIFVFCRPNIRVLAFGTLFGRYYQGNGQLTPEFLIQVNLLGFGFPWRLFPQGSSNGQLQIFICRIPQSELCLPALLSFTENNKGTASASSSSPFNSFRTSHMVRDSTLSKPVIFETTMTCGLDSIFLNVHSVKILQPRYYSSTLSSQISENSFLSPLERQLGMEVSSRFCESFQ